MKKILYLAVPAFLLSGCDDFLDTESYTQKNTENFPANVEDVDVSVISIYNTLNTAVGDPQNTYFYAAELASDDRFGGGGSNDKLMQAWDKLQKYEDNDSQTYWAARYNGIFRANSALAAIEKMGLEASEDSAAVKQLKGEALFLRAFFYHELAEMYGEVPLVLTTASVNLPKANADSVYARIATDLIAAIKSMKNQTYDKYTPGRVTKWAAEALLARVYLFYTGFYEKTDMPLATGGRLEKSTVVAYLEDCINNSGHKLVGDFRDLFPYTCEKTKADFAQTAAGASIVGVKGVDGNDLNWAGDGNSESIFAIKFSNFANWNTTIGYSNQYLLHFGIRGGQNYANTFPLGAGWGAGPVNPTLWSDWAADEPDDIRRMASVMPVRNLPNYKYGGWNDMIEETDYWQMKCCHITAKGPADADGNDTYYSSFSVPMFGATDNFQLDGVNDLVLIRLADVYLMHSELTGTNTYMNLVRKRAGLSDKPYSLENIQKERRYELAFEGRRWADIRRWHVAKDLLAKQTNSKIYNLGSPVAWKSFGGGYAARYEETKGFFAIPQSQIDLSNGVLVQTPGYEQANENAKYPGW